MYIDIYCKENNIYIYIYVTCIYMAKYMSVVNCQTCNIAIQRRAGFRASEVIESSFKFHPHRWVQA